MSNKETTQELMNKLTDKLIIPLVDNEIICPTCKGLRIIYKQDNYNEGHIENCRDCYNGKLYVCKHCGKANKTNHCDCKKSQEERESKFRTEQYEKEQKLFEKANKIKFRDYNGYFLLDGDEFVRDSDDIYNRVYDRIKYEKATNDDLPTFLWATAPEPVFTLDLEDIIYDKCEGGYEDMDSNLNMGDEDLKKAQEYLNEWYKKQGDYVNTYYEDTKTAVLLDDVIKEIRQEIENEVE
jgi:hypothetical protein